LQRSENYDHDLLRRVVRELLGTPAGADALVALLALGPYGSPWFDDDDFLPDEFAGPALHRRIISILESPSWLKLQDMRLTQIRAEAYETWWSLSRADAQDPELSQNAVSASDYSRGADLARQKAIELYQGILAVHDDPALRVRVGQLRKRRDTYQRAWFRRIRLKGRGNRKCAQCRCKSTLRHASENPTAEPKFPTSPHGISTRYSRFRRLRFASMGGKIGKASPPSKAVQQTGITRLAGGRWLICWRSGVTM